MSFAMRVMPERCDTCVFGPNSPIAPERFQELREQWTERGNEHFQVCHQTGTWDGDDPENDAPPPIDQIAVCRGFYDEMYIERGIAVSALQIAERLGVLRFEVPERTD